MTVTMTARLHLPLMMDVIDINECCATCALWDLASNEKCVTHKMYCHHHVLLSCLQGRPLRQSAQYSKSTAGSKSMQKLAKFPLDMELFLFLLFFFFLNKLADLQIFKIVAEVNSTSWTFTSQIQYMVKSNYHWYLFSMLKARWQKNLQCFHRTQG